MIGKWPHMVALCKIQPRAVLAAAILPVLGACTQVTVPLGSNDVQTPIVLSGEMGLSADEAFTDIDAQDRAEIAAVLADLISKETATQTVATEMRWLNGESGNSGTVSKLDLADYQATGCFSFQTTANTIAGVKLYSGTACKDARNILDVASLRVTEA
ncbi:outer membrane surface antigen [Roseibium hamelinense]|uniref:Outer membrane surface antigen n=1 Tax=Roseibium hamelinense TaxID=150831 RepID=A0A562SVB5_9HYPH|nr:outer membrane surface antigen [Roseibium hamelinense]